MIQPKPTSVSQKGDIVAEINFNYSDEGLKSLSDGTKTNLIYEVQPIDKITLLNDPFAKA